MASSVRMDVKEVLRHFQQLEDPRSSVNLLHPLDSVVVIAIMAVLAGANGPTAIARWANMKAEILVESAGPSAWHSPERCLPACVGHLEARRLSSLFHDVADSVACRSGGGHGCGIGQRWPSMERPCGAVTIGAVPGGALHSVSVWASEFGLTLAQVATAEKSNEITAIPTLLSLIDIHGAIITIDAMGTQTVIAEKIIEGGGDYLLALKGNQGTLHDAAIDYIHEQTKTDFRGMVPVAATPWKRSTAGWRDALTSKCLLPKSLPGFAHWKGLLSIGLAFLHCIRDGKETTEVAIHQQSARQGETVCPRGSQSLGHREQLSLVPRCDLSRG